MAQKVQTELVDDIDGSEAVETVRFGYDGRDYEIDLNDAHISALDEFLASYIANARRVTAARAGSARVAHQSANGNGKRTDIAQIRAWARGQGFQVAERGRIPADIVEKYDAR